MLLHEYANYDGSYFYELTRYRITNEHISNSHLVFDAQCRYEWSLNMLISALEYLIKKNQILLLSCISK
jgi:hypothetical protein